VDDVLMVFADVPAVTLPRAVFETGMAATEMAVTAGLAASKGEAARLIKQGGLSVNDRKLTDERGVITLDQAFGGQLYIIRKGRRQTHVVKLAD
jgi:tyrosyl-tRNA synthetase